MNDESDLNMKEVHRHAREFTSGITKMITSRERSKEATCGAIMALANLMVMVVTIILPDRDKAMEVVVAAISKAFRLAEERNIRERVKEAREAGATEVIVYEINPNPKTPRK